MTMGIWILGVHSPTGIEHVEFPSEAVAIAHAYWESHLPHGYHAHELREPGGVVLDHAALTAKVDAFGATELPKAKGG